MRARRRFCAISDDGLRPRRVRRPDRRPPCLGQPTDWLLCSARVKLRVPAGPFLASSSEPVMPLAAPQRTAGHEVIATLGDAIGAVEALFADARQAVANRVTIEGRTVSRVFDREQRATHGLAWLATYVEALRQLAAYAQRLVRHRQFRRDRRACGAHRRRRIPRAGDGRHCHEPRRDRALVRSRAHAGRGCGAAQPRRRASHRNRQYRAAPRAPGRADPAESRRHGRRLRARRHARTRSARRCASSPTTASRPMRRRGI